MFVLPSGWTQSPLRATRCLHTRRRRSGEIEVEAPEQPLMMLGARVELLHALNNILANAENHAGGVSAMLVRRAGTKVEIVVEDQGPGVSGEHLPRLTERFYRVDVADSRNRGGTGLGLAIVKHVVVRHQGELGDRERTGGR